MGTRNVLSGFETFEVMVLVILVLTLIYKMGRRACGKEGWMAKMKEAKKKSEARKLKKIMPEILAVQGEFT